MHNGVGRAPREIGHYRLQRGQVAMDIRNHRDPHDTSMPAAPRSDGEADTRVATNKLGAPDRVRPHVATSVAASPRPRSHTRRRTEVQLEAMSLC
jgi:hypothetical protein